MKLAAIGSGRTAKGHLTAIVYYVFTQLNVCGYVFDTFFGSLDECLCVSDEKKMK